MKVLSPAAKCLLARHAAPNDPAPQGYSRRIVRVVVPSAAYGSHRGVVMSRSKRPAGARAPGGGLACWHLHGHGGTRQEDVVMNALPPSPGGVVRAAGHGCQQVAAVFSPDDLVQAAV